MASTLSGSLISVALSRTLTGFCARSWEFPGKQSIGCNVVSPSDTANYLLFLQELRKDPIGAQLILTAAVVDAVRETGKDTTFTIEFYPRVAGNAVNYTLTV